MTLSGVSTIGEANIFRRNSDLTSRQRISSSSSSEYYFSPEIKREGSIKEPSECSQLRYSTRFMSVSSVYREMGFHLCFSVVLFFILLFNTNAALLSPVQWKIETQYSMRGALNGTLVAVLCPFPCQTQRDVAFEKLIMVIHSRCVENKTECAINKFHRGRKKKRDGETGAKTKYGQHTI